MSKNSFNETKAWSDLASTDVSVMEAACLAIMARLNEGKHLREADPITRVFNALMAHGRMATTSMLRAFVNHFGQLQLRDPAAGPTLIHPQILNLLRERAQREKKGSGKVVKKGSKKPKAKKTAANDDAPDNHSFSCLRDLRQRLSA